MLAMLALIALDFGPKFSLGQVCITPNAMSKIPKLEIEKALQRHVRGDWGELCEEDWQGNDISLKTECRILSAYRAGNGVILDATTSAGGLAGSIAGPPENAREHIRFPIDHVGVVVAPGRNHADVLWYRGMGGTRPLAIYDLVKITRVTDIGRLQSASWTWTSSPSSLLVHESCG